MIKCRFLMGLIASSYEPAFGMPGPALYAATRSRGINKKVYRLHDCALRTRNNAAPAGKSSDRRAVTLCWHRPGFQICPCALADVTLLDRGLLSLHTRGDRCDHLGRLAERGLTIFDPVAPGYPCEVGICSPHGAGLVLEHQQPHGPIEACDGIGSYELRAQSRIPEDQKRGWTQFDARLCGEFRLVYRGEERYAFAGDVLFQPVDRLVQSVSTATRDDPIVYRLRVARPCRPGAQLRRG